MRSHFPLAIFTLLAVGWSPADAEGPLQAMRDSGELNSLEAIEHDFDMGAYVLEVIDYNLQYEVLSDPRGSM